VAAPASASGSHARRLLTLATAALGGLAATQIGLPLPWVLGAMGATALAMLAGFGAPQPAQGRRLAQVIIGTALGLTFTQEVIREVLSLGHWILAGSAFAIVLTMLFARVLQLLAAIDGVTAIYAVAVGASAEMALQAHNAGANGAKVASAHAVRIILVVSLASVVAHYSGQTAVAVATAQPTTIGWPLALLFVALAPLCGWIGDRIHLPNPWLLGPVLMAGGFASQAPQGRMFPAVLIAAQVLIGWSLGQHMTRQFFVESPRLLASATAVTLCMLGLSILLALGLARSGSTPFLTAFLAVAPGGTAEMAIVAKSYGIGAPIVTAFHFFRVVTMIVTIRWIVRFLRRSGWVRVAQPAASGQDGDQR
jgi:hypothetical protein